MVWKAGRRGGRAIEGRESEGLKEGRVEKDSGKDGGREILEKEK